MTGPRPDWLNVTTEDATILRDRFLADARREARWSNVLRLAGAAVVGGVVGWTADVPWWAVPILGAGLTAVYFGGVFDALARRSSEAAGVMRRRLVGGRRG